MISNTFISVNSKQHMPCSCALAWFTKFYSRKKIYYYNRNFQFDKWKALRWDKGTLFVDKGIQFM